MEGRATLSKRALPLLRQLPDGVFKTLMFQALADRAGIDLESLKKLDVPPPASYADAPRYAPTYADTPPQPHETPPDYTYHDIHDSQSTLTSEADAPRQREPLSRQMKVHATLTQAALALLLHKPSIAQQVEPRSLKDLDGQEGELLLSVIELLHKRPESTTGMLLGHWYGTAEGTLLAELAGQERLIPTEGIEAQFEDIMRRLTSLPLRQRIVEEINAFKSRPYEQLSEDDRARLPEMIRALRDLDARSRPSNS